MTLDLLTSVPVLNTGQAMSAKKLDMGILGKIGTLQTRLARNSQEIEAAQRVRFEIFSQGMQARLSTKAGQTGLDCDRFDAFCDHLIVLDTAINGGSEDQIVATYRLLRQDIASKNGGFYSSAEFDIASLEDRHQTKNFMELGRSCVLPAYRNKRTAELLWQGNWSYAISQGIDVMFGCASFPGTVIEKHALALSFLHHHARASGEWSVAALSQHFRSMDLMPLEAVGIKQALMAMPPLIKGYLRLGAKFGDGAVVDPDFGTTDVLVVLPVNHISARYLAHYGTGAERFA